MYCNYQNLPKKQSFLEGKELINLTKKNIKEKDDLTDNEKNEAKTNGFILLGMTGAGKTTLLNAMFGKEVGKVERNLKRVTQ